MASQPFELSKAQRKTLAAQLTLIAESASWATREVRGARPFGWRLRQSAVELLVRATRAALSRPALTCGLLLAYAGAAASLWAGNADGAQALGDIAGVTAVFLGVGFCLFGVPVLPDVRRNHFGVDQPGTLVAAKPEVFVSLFVRPDELVGHAISAGHATLQALPPCAGVTTAHTPTAYVLLRRPDGRLQFLTNTQTLESYAWFTHSPLLALQRHAWSRAFHAKCAELGVLQTLDDLVRELVSADARIPHPEEAPPLQATEEPRYRVTCRCGTPLTLSQDELGQANACPECGAAFMLELLEGVLQATWLGGRLDAPPLTPTEARAVLGVTESADDAELKQAWRRAAQHCHPDRYAQLPVRMQKLAAAETARVNQAYQLLCGEQQSG